MVTYDGPVHYKDTTGTWQNIDTSLVQASPGHFQTKANSVTVTVASADQDPNLVSVSEKDVSIGMSLVGALAGQGVTSLNTISHPNILPGVTQTFGSVTDGLKDSLILASPAAGSVFTYQLSLKGVKASIEQASGDIVYIDSSGAVRARTPRG